MKEKSESSASAISEKYRLENEKHDHVFRVAVIGASGVGKTSLIQQVAEGTFTESHLSKWGAAFKFKQLNTLGKKVKLQIIDAPLEDNYQMRACHGFVLVYDTTDLGSFNQLPELYEKAKTLNPDAKFFMVGTKEDLPNKRVVDYKVALDYANQLDIPYIDTSAKTGNNVIAVFTELAKLLVEKLQNALAKVTTPKAPSSNKSSFFSCCSFGGDDEPTKQTTPQSAI